MKRDGTDRAVGAEKNARCGVMVGMRWGWGWAFLGKMLVLFCGFVFQISLAHGDSFGIGANEFAIDFVTIGNPGNGGDPFTADLYFPGSIGAVAYEYRMGTYEISRNQIDAAVNSGLEHVNPLYGIGNKPVAGITWYEAGAYVNWLNESTGHEKAYNLTWTGTQWTMDFWNEEHAWTLGGLNRFRNKDAFYFVPSESEWYKAAYHANDGATSDYYRYATGSNDLPIRVNSGTDPGTAVTFGFGNPGPNGPADVDQAGGLSAYGTMGQTGNVFEWMETDTDGLNDDLNQYRAIRGGNWVDYAQSDFRTAAPALDYSGNGLGMRVASISEAPEPSVSCLLLMGLGGLLWIGRVKRGSQIQG